MGALRVCVSESEGASRPEKGGGIKVRTGKITKERRRVGDGRRGGERTRGGLQIPEVINK